MKRVSLCILPILLASAIVVGLNVQAQAFLLQAAPPPGCVGVAVAVASGIQNAVNANPSGTTFCLAAGTYGESVVPKSNDVFIGAGIGMTILNGGGSLAYGFQTDSTNANLINNVTIKNLTVTNYTAVGIGGAGGLGGCNVTPGWTINLVEASFNFVGIDACAWGSGGSIQNSLIHHNQANGLSTVNVTGLTINNNDVYNNNTSCQNANITNAGWKMSGGNGITVTNNKIHDQGAGCDQYGHPANGFGVWSDGFAIHVYINNNELYHNEAGIYLEILQSGGSTTDNTVYNNYIHDNYGEGLVLATAGDTDVSGNAFSNNGIFTIWQLEENRNTDGCPPGVEARCSTSNIHYHGNYLAYGSNTYGNGQVNTKDTGARGPYGNWQAQNVVYDTNTYYIPCGSSDFNNNGTNLSRTGWQALVSTPDANSTFKCGQGPSLPAGVGPLGGYTGAGP